MPWKRHFSIASQQHFHHSSIYLNKLIQKTIKCVCVLRRNCYRGCYFSSAGADHMVRGYYYVVMLINLKLPGFVCFQFVCMLCDARLIIILVETNNLYVWDEKLSDRHVWYVIIFSKLNTATQPLWMWLRWMSTKYSQSMACIICLFGTTINTYKWHKIHFRQSERQVGLICTHTQANSMYITQWSQHISNVVTFLYVTLVLPK
jgi:hypothetical protein